MGTEVRRNRQVEAPASLASSTSITQLPSPHCTLSSKSPGVRNGGSGRLPMSASAEQLRSVRICLGDISHPPVSTAAEHCGEVTSHPRYKAMSTLLNRSGKLLPGDFEAFATNEVAFMNSIFADALWDYVAVDPEELSFVVGDTIEVTDMEDDEWWGGTANGTTGWFPANYVRLRVFQSVSPTPSATQITSSSSSASIATPLSSQPCVRRMVIEEILNSERCYVGHLKDIVEGYITEARKKTSLFDEETVALVFGNVEEILAFQSDFLAKMESCVDKTDPAATVIGPLFVERELQFNVYSRYCTNHPHAVKELDKLQSDRLHKLFFEACRLMRQMANLSLGSFLLTPVQKICKYPLQIQELLKHTESSHPDYEHVVQAHECMSKVAESINELKRRTECIEKIVAWQSKVIAWTGDNITALSTVLIHSGQLVKLSKGRAQPRMFFLFDHQLVWCKNEGRDRLYYRGRLSTKDCLVDKVDCPVKDGGEKMGGQHYALSLFNSSKNKWYALRAYTEQTRDRWFEAFQTEQELVSRANPNGLAESGEWQSARAKTAPPSSRRKSSLVDMIRSVTPSALDEAKRQPLQIQPLSPIVKRRTLERIRKFHSSNLT
ncbi:rho guanine nucleotide exchange factor 4-like [Sycon ciliatum]|uniref:rho guanine nucleotide exchange factor 4-like n=1 Tax=Sycon ciliatum TaxID=27933 RepID=UPI0031F718F6